MELLFIGTVLQDALSEVVKVYLPLQLKIFVMAITAFMERRNQGVGRFCSEGCDVDKKRRRREGSEAVGIRRGARCLRRAATRKRELPRMLHEKECRNVGSGLEDLRREGRRAMSLPELERFDYRAGENNPGAITQVHNLALAFEFVSFPVVWAWGDAFQFRGRLCVCCAGTWSI